MRKYFNPFFDKTFAIALASRAPHGRSFASVEHPELDGTPVCYNTHFPAHGIYLAHDLSFGNTTHCGVATHLGNLIHVHCDE